MAAGRRGIRSGLVVMSLTPFGINSALAGIYSGGFRIRSGAGAMKLALFGIKSALAGIKLALFCPAPPSCDSVSASVAARLAGLGWLLAAGAQDGHRLA